MQVCEAALAEFDFADGRVADADPACFLVEDDEKAAFGGGEAGDGCGIGTGVLLLRLDAARGVAVVAFVEGSAGGRLLLETRWNAESIGGFVEEFLDGLFDE